MSALVVLLALASASAPAAPATCPWAEPRSAPTLQLEGGQLRFRWPLDDAWFKCAREKGGGLSVTFFLRDRTRGLVKARSFERAGADVDLRLPVADLCAAGLASEALVRVVGTGPMDRLLFETPAVPLPCFACPRPAEALLTIGEDRDAPPGFLTVHGRYDADFQRCAAAKKGTLWLRFYVGDSQLEAETRRDASFVLRGLEKQGEFRKAFAPTNLCREGKWLGVEFTGTGEFRQLGTHRRETQPLTCPANL